MGTLQIGAENAPGNVLVTSANGGGIVGFNGAMFDQNAARQGLWGYRVDTTPYVASPTLIQALDADTVRVAAAAGNTARTRIYFRLSALPASGSYSKLFAILANSDIDDLAWVQVQSNGTLVLRDRQDATIGAVSTFVVAINTWYRLELNVAPLNTNSATSKVLVACGPAAATFTATNSASQWYVYSTTWNAWGPATVTVPPGIGKVRAGKIAAVAHTAVLDFDDFAFDNGTWTNVPSTWWGKATPILSDTNAMRATPSLAIAGVATKVWSDVFTPRATPALVVTASPLQKAGALVLAATAVKLIPNASVSHQYSLSASAAAALALNAPPVGRSYVLPVGVSPAMVVNAAGLQKSAALALAAAAALGLDGFRGSSAGVTMGVAASALYGPTIDVQGFVGMDIRPTMEVAIDTLWQDFFLADAVSSMGLGSLRVASPGLAVRATPTLALAPDLSRSVTLAMRGVPVLVMLGRKDLAAGVVSAAILARLVLTGRLTITRTLVMRAVATMIHFGATIGEVRTYDNVFAIILSQGSASRLFELGVIAELVDNGVRLADVLGGPFGARPLSGGMLAIIQD